jgi:formylglycine-generating enzyme required for sulfatase activity
MFKPRSSVTLWSFLALLLFWMGAASAQQGTDPVATLVGEWDLPGSLTRIKINADRTVDHSKLGSGIIRYEEASFYRVVFRHHHLSCRYEVRKYSESELTFTVATQPSDSDCELGALRRSPGTTPPQVPGRRSDARGPQSTPGTTLRDCDDCPELVIVPSGRFTMGSSESEVGRWPTEGPQRSIVMPAPFAVGRYAITRDQFEAFVNATGYLYGDGCQVEHNGTWLLRREINYRAPGFPQDGRHPAVCISWDDAKAYVAWLSSKTGKNFRLLTEAEREYVTRAGNTTPYWWGSSLRPDWANYDKRERTPRDGRSGSARDTKKASLPLPSSASNAAATLVPSGTVPVNSFSPNPWGLYQVHGNVAEWVEDCWNKTYSGLAAEPLAATQGDCERRVLRGGAWSYWPSDIRAAYREAARKGDRYVHVGFRIARDLVP